MQSMASDAAEAAERVRPPIRALAGYGERYTAGRLLLEFALRLDSSAREQLTEEAAERFDALGALASAAQARDLSPRPL